MGAALALEKTFPDATITMVEPKKAFLHNIASVRAVATPSFGKKIVIPYEKLFKQPQNKVVHAYVTSIGKNSVVLDREVEGVSLSFDYAIIAVGGNYVSPFHSSACEKDDMIAELENVAEKVKEAEKIVIVGAGPVGLVISLSYMIYTYLIGNCR